MSGSKEAVELATHLPEIGFPEFTTKLVSDVFDTLIASNLRQTEAYVELIKQTSKSLTAFINDTKDDIDGSMVLQFLVKVLGTDDNGNAIVKEGVKLKKEEADKLNEALEVSDAGLASDNKVASHTEELKGEKYQAILDAVASRLAADKYTLLKEMIKQGLLRLVIEKGEIETRLTFNTFGSSYLRDNASSYERKNFNVRANAKTGGLLSGWVKASASTSYNSIKVSTATKTDIDRSSSSVQIYGRVHLNFKTDYLPLDQD